tara:strand:+ start:27387 stop:28007 length:621 start_codon:yes stop_codon:yes gene_type:complete
LSVLIATQALNCERDERLLVQQLNLSVAEGEIYQVEGPNGSGKTTLLRVLCGLSTRYSGEIFWRGQAIKAVRHQYLSELLYLGHQSGIKSVLSPRENLQWHAAVKGVQAHDAIDAALAKVGLYGYEDAPCYSLSAGQQRRVALARLFISHTPLWILDEPFTAIDKKGVAELEGWIVQHAQQGGSVLLTTHHDLNLPMTLNKVVLGG